jgi:hypothetical protein
MTKHAERGQLPTIVIPAKAGISIDIAPPHAMPASAGMTAVSYMLAHSRELPLQSSPAFAGEEGPRRSAAGK